MGTRPGVYVTESVLTTPVADAVASAAAGALVAPLPSGPTTPVLVTSWYQFTNLFGGFDSAYPATFGANQFFRTGGRDLYVGRVVKSDAVAASVVLKTTDDATWLTFTAKGAGSFGNSLRVLITKKTSGLYDVSVVQEAGVAGQTGDDTVLESFTNLPLATHGSAEVTSIFTVRSQWVSVAYDSGAAAKTITATLAPLVLAGGSDGTSGGTYNYTSALTKLAEIDRSLVVFSPGNIDNTAVSAMVSFAEDHDGFAVLDTGAGLSASAAVTYAGTVGVSSHAAVYYPHMWVADPTSASRDAIRLTPPSGAVAGLFLATDASRGVFKAPAGIDAAIPGVVAMEKNLTSTELDSLNDAVSPVNAIRNIAGVGPAVMGARTLDAGESTQYINIRRSLTYLTRELKKRLEFAVFENNDLTLWRSMSTVADSFLTGFWSAGGLRGAVKAQAFYIKIDSENNSANDIANGIVNIEVGVALQYPAEFVKIQLTQQTLS